MYQKLKDRLFHILRRELSSDAVIAMVEYAHLDGKITEDQRNELSRDAYILGIFRALVDFMVMHPLPAKDGEELEQYTQDLTALAMMWSPEFIRGTVSRWVFSTDLMDQTNVLAQSVEHHFGQEAGQILRDQMETWFRAKQDLTSGLEVDRQLARRR